jgi:hypothetical protein
MAKSGQRIIFAQTLNGKTIELSIVERTTPYSKVKLWA